MKRNGQLPIRYIQVLTLAKIGYTPHQIGEILGCSRYTAKVLVHRARRAGHHVEQFPRGPAMPVCGL